MERKLAIIRDFIVDNLPTKIDKFVFSEDFMDHLATKIQIQNYLYRTKKTFLDYLEEEVFSFNSYPAQDFDNILSYPILNSISASLESTQETPQYLSCSTFFNLNFYRFVFLIQTKKGLTGIFFFNKWHKFYTINSSKCPSWTRIPNIQVKLY